MAIYYKDTQVDPQSTYVPLPLEAINNIMQQRQHSIDTTRQLVAGMDDHLGIQPISVADKDVARAKQLQTDYSNKINDLKIQALDPSRISQTAMQIIALNKQKKDLMDKGGEGYALNNNNAMRLENIKKIQEGVQKGEIDSQMANQAIAYADALYKQNGQYGGTEDYLSKSYTPFVPTNTPKFKEQLAELDKQYKDDATVQSNFNPNNPVYTVLTTTGSTRDKAYHTALVNLQTPENAGYLNDKIMLNKFALSQQKYSDGSNGLDNVLKSIQSDPSAGGLGVAHKDKAGKVTYISRVSGMPLDKMSDSDKLDEYMKLQILHPLADSFGLSRGVQRQNLEFKENGVYLKGFGAGLDAKHEADNSLGIASLNLGATPSKVPFKNLQEYNTQRQAAVNEIKNITNALKGNVTAAKLQELKQQLEQSKRTLNDLDNIKSSVVGNNTYEGKFGTDADSQLKSSYKYLIAHKVIPPILQLPNGEKVAFTSLKAENYVLSHPEYAKQLTKMAKDHYMATNRVATVEDNINTYNKGNLLTNKQMPAISFTKDSKAYKIAEAALNNPNNIDKVWTHDEKTQEFRQALGNDGQPDASAGIKLWDKGGDVHIIPTSFSVDTHNGQHLMTGLKVVKTIDPSTRKEVTTKIPITVTLKSKEAQNNVSLYLAKLAHEGTNSDVKSAALLMRANTLLDGKLDNLGVGKTIEGAHSTNGSTNDIQLELAPKSNQAGTDQPRYLVKTRNGYLKPDGTYTNDKSDLKKLASMTKQEAAVRLFPSVTNPVRFDGKPITDEDRLVTPANLIDKYLSQGVDYDKQTKAHLQTYGGTTTTTKGDKTKHK